MLSTENIHWSKHGRSHVLLGRWICGRATQLSMRKISKPRRRWYQSLCAIEGWTRWQRVLWILFCRPYRPNPILVARLRYSDGWYFWWAPRYLWSESHWCVVQNLWLHEYEQPLGYALESEYWFVACNLVSFSYFSLDQGWFKRFQIQYDHLHLRRAGLIVNFTPTAIWIWSSRSRNWESSSRMRAQVPITANSLTPDYLWTRNQTS